MRWQAAVWPVHWVSVAQAVLLRQAPPESDPFKKVGRFRPTPGRSFANQVQDSGCLATIAR
jgi:hypothetical protein